MPARKKIDLEKVNAALATPCPPRPAPSRGQKPLPEREVGWRHTVCNVFSGLGSPDAPSITWGEILCTTLLR